MALCKLSSLMTFGCCAEPLIDGRLVDSRAFLSLLSLNLDTLNILWNLGRDDLMLFGYVDWFSIGGRGDCG